MSTATALTFELRYRKEGRVKVRGKMTRDPDRFASLPDRPAQFDALVGSYKKVSDQAKRLNDVQTRSGFMDYLFFPEVDTAPVGSDDWPSND